MAIKDKEGKVYKLRGPNPLMKDQVDWDKKKTKLINVGWESEVIEDKRNPVKKFETDFNVVKIGDELGLIPNKEATAVVQPQEFIKEIQESKPEVIEPVIEDEPTPEPVEPPPAPKPKEVILDVDQRLARILRERGVQYYCAPAVGKKLHVDDLYDSRYHTIQYGDKYIFDAIVIDQSDLQLQFWCVKPLNVESIIYRKIKEGGERWWRVNDIEPKTGGYLVLAIPSDTNPDFG